jgi:hypothetical protein
MGTVGNIIDVNLLRRNIAGDRDLLSELINVFQQELLSIQSAILTGRVNQDGTAIAST